MSRRRLPERNDTGASLIFVLAFVTGVGLIVSALLTFSGTALGGVKSTKYRNDTSYDADGALKAGITQIRNSTFTNATSSPAECNGFLNDPAAGKGATNAMVVSGANLGRSVAVTCQGGPKTGVDGGNDQINDANRPSYSLLTLDTTTSGFKLADNKSAFTIDGSAFVNGPIDVNPGNLVVHGDFSANGGAKCSGVQATGTRNCNASTPQADPNLPQPVTTADLVYRAPQCPTDTSKTVTLSPGFYGDATALNALTQAGCANAHTVLLQSGTYVLDFKNAGTHTWAIANSAVSVIGGTPSGWTEATGYPGSATSTTAACIAPERSVTNGGVTLVFGGDSTVDVSAGRFEMCAPYSATTPPVAIYGAKNAVPQTQSNTQQLLVGTTVPTTPNDYSVTAADLSKLSAADGAAVSATATKTKAASVLFPNFGGNIGIPAGATVTSATLTVSHKEDNGDATDVPDPQITVTPTPGGTPIVATPAATGGLAANTTGSYATQTATLGQAFLDAVKAGGLKNLSLQYDAPKPKKTSYDSSLDYLRLDLTWVGPGLAAQPAAGPTVISGPADGGGLLIEGTTYVPRSAVAIDLKKGARVDFTWGLIARQVTMATYGNTDQPADVPIFGLPKPVHGADVYFTAYVYQCAGNALVCTSPTYPATNGGSWVRAATARVTFESNNPDLTQPNNRQVLVRSWTVRR